ncbi:hypothetical protein [Deinococcus sp.]|uniref:hypothetical protein n=1 Tax=Deinococcus sp. TaxID=47478 RepID=UPI0025C51AFD|nr:hypothetical protein [Deinococcus sp.]
MIRVFGVAAYPHVMQMPPRLISRAAEIHAEREAEARLNALDDASTAAGLKLGQRYVDPKNPSGQAKKGDPYYSLDPFNAHLRTIEKRARPWLYTPAAIRTRRELEEERRWQQVEKTLGGMQA